MHLVEASHQISVPYVSELYLFFSAILVGGGIHHYNHRHAYA